ncbi:hypothetical protein [Ramlibacter sp.]|uniref:hypothetical protein n=1 Tax=Ramlibacter sp. TaxID=1917967 RepID=UPI002FCA49A2
MDLLRTTAALALALLLPMSGHSAGAIGPTALRARHATLAPQLADNAFGGRLVLQSEETARRIDGDVYAVVEHPFSAVAEALSDPAQWCEILILHLNTKYCRMGNDNGGVRVEVRVGKKHPQAIHAASLLAFNWRAPTLRPEYLAVQMDASDGPYDTRDYRLMAEAVPLEGRRTFLHMGYAMSYGGASDFAMHLYLSTLARDKVGFTRSGAPSSTEEGYIGGMRGVAERNTMRYYLAIETYLDSLTAPAEQRVEKRLRAWFDATEKYPRQLREVDREAYLNMKRAEIQRQGSGR